MSDYVEILKHNFQDMLKEIRGAEKRGEIVAHLTDFEIAVAFANELLKKENATEDEICEKIYVFAPELLGVDK